MTTTNLIPPEIKGKNTDLTTSVEAGTSEEASAIFKMANDRMLSPHEWHKLCGTVSAGFKLTNDKAVIVNRLAKEGDYLQIDIPGPGPSKGDGFDWVKVELIEDNRNADADEESCGMKVRASGRPGAEANGTAHFFKGTATSSFVIYRKGNKVTASYYGRNETPNVSTGKMSDNVRNSMVAIGAFAFLSELQWAALIEGFLKKKESHL